MKSFGLTFLFICFAGYAQAQCAIACNNLTNFAIDPNGLTEVEPEAVLEGNYDNCVNFTPVVTLKDFSSGTDIPTSPYLSANEVGMEVLVTVTDVSTGNACWGKIIVESINSLSSGIFDCAGDRLAHTLVNMTTTAPNVALNLANCNYDGNNLLEYVNCVASQNNMPAGIEYVITPKVLTASGIGEDYLNGVSTLDLVQIVRHILAVKPFDHTCQLIAADVSNDGQISALDIIILRQLILHITTTLPNAPSWKFFNSSAFETNDFGADNDLKFSQDEFPLNQLRITAVKLGDVNGTAITGN